MNGPNNISPQTSQKSVTGLRSKMNYNDVPSDIKQVAEGMETQFINYMLSKMNEGVNQENPDDSITSYYKSLLTNERSEMMAKDARGGIGLKEIIIEQLYPAARQQHVDLKQASSKYLQAMEGSNE